MKFLNLRTYTVLTYLSLSLKNKVSPLRFLSINKEHISFENGNYSKNQINSKIPKKFQLNSTLINLNKTLNDNVKNLEKKFTYPLVIKPDWGESALGVWKVKNQNELKKRLVQIRKAKIQYMAQAYCKHFNEYDVIYISSKSTNYKKKILDITRIDSPKVKGDGKSTIAKLISKNFAQYQDYLLNINQDKLKRIPKKEQNINLTNINSRLYGSTYVDIRNKVLKNEDKIIKNLNKLGKFRLAKVTVKAKNEVELTQGNFKVIEINILYPLMNSIFREDLSQKERKNLVKTYLQTLFPIIKEVKFDLSIWQVLKFYFKNLSQKNKLKKLSKKW